MFEDNELNEIIESFDEPNETIINDIVVLHEMTLGDVVIATLLIAILIWMILSRVIRRSS